MSRIKKNQQPSMERGNINEAFQKGIQLQTAGKLKEAHNIFSGLLQQAPRETPLLNRLGQVAFALGNLNQAVAFFSKSVASNPNQDEVFANLGVVHRRLKQFDEAKACQQKAILLNPHNASAYNNLGIVLHEAFNQSSAALDALNRSLELKNDYADAYYNKGNILRDLRRFEDAIECYKTAIKLRPTYCGAYTNMAIAYSAQKNYPEAIKYYQKAVELGAPTNYIFGQYLYTKLHVCDWHDLDEHLEKLVNDIHSDLPATAPFPLHALIDDPAIQLKATATFTRIDYPQQFELSMPAVHPEHKRIRIGYFSSDYWNHPVAHLMLGLFAAHNRARYEVIAFSYGSPVKDQWHERVRASCDRFIDVSELTDKEIAKLARQMEIDIAIDLNGYTENRRTGAFAYRTAPLQVSYIGFLGTMASPYIDYLIADTTIIPAESRAFYSEKIIYLPSFQSNDPLQQPSDKPINREALGLPENAFVFCSFNNNFKITPATFNSWMRILARVPQSVLWLYVNNNVAQENLCKEAKARNIDPDRLIFAGKLPLSEHLARLKLADLFLDTLPYNAGATASNALRVGLPVLTLTGRSFAARMGTSLLKAVGVPELITDTQQAYEDMAVSLAEDTHRLRTIRDKLILEASTSSLFDNQRFARNIETAFETIHQRACEQLSPIHILVQ